MRTRLCSTTPTATPESGYEADDDANAEDITTGAKNGLKLVELRGVDYNDPKWDDLLDQMTIDEMQQLIGFGGYQTAAVTSIEKVRTNDCDGPASINNNFTGVGSVGFPAAYPHRHDLEQGAGPRLRRQHRRRWPMRWTPPAGTAPL